MEILDKTKETVEELELEVTNQDLFSSCMTFADLTWIFDWMSKFEQLQHVSNFFFFNETLMEY